MCEHIAYISEMYDFRADETNLTPMLKRSAEARTLRSDDVERGHSNLYNTTNLLRLYYRSHNQAVSACYYVKCCPTQSIGISGEAPPQVFINHWIKQSN